MTDCFLCCMMYALLEKFFKKENEVNKLLEESLEKTVYGICTSNSLEDKEKISKILHVIEVFAIEQERDNRISKTLKSQISAFTKYMNNIDKGKISTGSYFMPRLYLYKEEKISYFGEAGMFFLFEDNCQFVKEIPEEYIIHVDEDYALKENFNQMFNLVQKYKSKKREFKLSLSYSEILAAKKFSPVAGKFFLPFLREIKNESDDNDIIHRWLNAYTLQIAFKIIGEDVIEFCMTDDYMDAMIATGYNDRVGNYFFLMSFSRYNNSISEYEEETNARRKRLETIKKAQEDMEKNVISKGKERKIKFTRIVNTGMPPDEDLPF